MTKLRILVFGVWCLVLAVGMKAAPPLRGLVPMLTGTTVSPTTRHPSPITLLASDVTCCPSSRASSVSGGSYLQHEGSPRVLTILAAYQDVGFIVNEPVKAFDQFLNAGKQENLGNSNHLNVASVRQYFETCSHGRFTPQFDVVGPVVLPHPLAYYGGSKNDGSDDRFGDLCQDAMTQAKPLVSDWSQYDNDGDGKVEMVCIIYAGYGQNQGGADNTVWAKAGYQGRLVDRSLSISYFNCVPELFAPEKGTDANGNPYDYSQYINGTGVFIHEMSHCMGLPDLYATRSRAYVNNQSMGAWSVMDYGLYNRNGFAPCPYTAWELEVMGWTEIEEVREVKEVREIKDLLPLTEGGKAYKLVNSHNDRDYIVMENVQQRGLNRYAYGHGLLVYHVDYPYTYVNMVDAPNNNPGHPSVAVVPAGGMLISNYLYGEDDSPYTRDEWKESVTSAVFPGTKQVTKLTDDMAWPNYCFYDGNTKTSVGYMLSGIAEHTETGTVSFSIVDGTTGIECISTGFPPGGNRKVYDLQGREVMNPTRGIYIVQGKKKVVH